MYRVGKIDLVGNLKLASRCRLLILGMFAVIMEDEDMSAFCEDPKSDPDESGKKGSGLTVIQEKKKPRVKKHLEAEHFLIPHKGE